MSTSSRWRVRKRFWALLALSLLFIAAFRVAIGNAARIRSYHRSNVEYLSDFPGVTGFLTVLADVDGLQRARLPDGTVEDRDAETSALLRRYDRRGVLRVEVNHDGDVRHCRYYDAEGRLRSDGREADGRRVGIWTAYDVVGSGPRWIWFWE